MKDRILIFFIFILITAPIVAAIIVGGFRYKKHKEAIKKELEEQYRKAQVKGGISSLYYKHPERRLFKRTFGIPILLGLLAQLLLIAAIYFIFK